MAIGVHAHLGALGWFLVLALRSSVARADMLVLDTCVGRCSADDLRTIVAVRRELGALEISGVVAGASEVRSRLGDGIPLPSVSDAELSAAELTAALESGIDDWASSSYDQAQARLGAALALAAANPMLVVADPTLRKLIPRAIVGRAVSFLRLGREDDAKAAIMDLVRITNETSILDRWGPEADRVFQLARTDATARGYGRLVIHVDDPAAMFFVDATGEPRRTTFAAEVVPGPVRILVRDARGEARRYVVTVVPGMTTNLDVRWSRDAAIDAASDGRRIGIDYRTADERAHEAAFARSLGQRANVSDVVVFGRVERDRGPVVVATVYGTADGRVKRTCTTSDAIAGEDHAGELAECIAAPERDDRGVQLRVVSSHAERELGGIHAIGLGVGIGGLIGFGLTGVFQATGADQHMGRGYLLSSAGVAIGVLTVVAYLRQRPRRTTLPGIAIGTTSHGGWATIGWGF